MLNSSQINILDSLLATLTDEQKIWASGYVQGHVSKKTVAAAQAINANIYYATETGNTKVLAQKLEKQLRASGIKTRCAPLGRLKVNDLATFTDPLIILSSTHGEGDPPEMSRDFFKALSVYDAPLPKLQYAVLGLGDKSYREFCGAAVTIDKKLEANGAKRIVPSALYDVDYETHAPKWFDELTKALSSLTNTPAKATLNLGASDEVLQSTRGFSRLEPVMGEIGEIINLNDLGSAKATYHIEVTIPEALAYNPGDALGILMPPLDGGEAPAPRLYSIASSPIMYPGSIHLTVAHSSYKRPDGTIGYGICSHWLSQRKVGDKIQVFVQRNLRFRLPPDDSTDIIMIGPGTGVAPFRGFMQERAERGATGRSWLFFGEQHAHCDFLYQAEWQDLLAQGSLTRFDGAFSRDQADRIYVQDRLRENAVEVWKWISGGARLYVCGSKSPMSEDVEKALIAIIAEHGGKSPDEAKEYLNHMAEDDRYLRDVY